jgi:hypothetical protein
MRSAPLLFVLGLDPRRDEALIAAALALAVELSQGRAEDEPAAMFFALSRRWAALGAAWDVMPLLCAQNLASALGARLVVEVQDWEAVKLRLRIVSGHADFAEVRAWVAERMRPL